MGGGRPPRTSLVSGDGDANGGVGAFGVPADGLTSALVMGGTGALLGNLGASDALLSAPKSLHARNS